MICLNFKLHKHEEFNTEKGHLGVIANTVMLRNNTGAF